MSKIPGVKKIVKFTKEIRGSFGRFKTDHSYRIHYVSTSIAIDDIDDLSTASELFSPDKIEFEELIQRDIDHSRVKKIANDYLSNGEGRVIFFPPLLACIALIDNDGGLKKQYSNVSNSLVTDSAVGPVLRTTWDKDGFELDLPEADSDSSDRTIHFEGHDHFYYDFAATLRFNPKKTKLVVLDGQHRLEALRLLRKNGEQNAIIAGLEIPVCVIWAPEAVGNQESNENMTQDFRELFVRVNSEPRKVSGHFIILLKDDSYSAMAIRRLADNWKAATASNQWSRLHLLEWNTREDERVDVRTRDFSITTVSIVAKILDEHLFSQGVAPDLLNLESSEVEFEKINPNFSWDGLVDRTHKSKIDDLVKKHIDQILVPALDVLFRSPTPYRRLENSLEVAFKRLQEKVGENNSSFISLKSILNSYIYREEEMFEESARAAYVDFKGWINVDPSDRIYFFSVFQQGLLRFWLNVSALLKPIGISADNSASIAVTALEKMVFQPKERFLTSDRRYTRRTLWRNENVNFGSTWAKNAWADLLVASLLHGESQNSIVKSLIDILGKDNVQSNEIVAQLNRVGYKSLSSYATRLKDELLKETKQEQGLVDFFGEDRAAQLRALRETSRIDFDLIIKKKTETRFQEAMSELADQLKLKTEELLKNLDVD
jgi:hypothetical protein